MQWPRRTTQGQAGGVQVEHGGAEGTAAAQGAGQGPGRARGRAGACKGRTRPAATPRPPTPPHSLPVGAFAQRLHQVPVLHEGHRHLQPRACSGPRSRSRSRQRPGHAALSRHRRELRPALRAQGLSPARRPHRPRPHLESRSHYRPRPQPRLPPLFTFKSVKSS